MTISDTPAATSVVNRYGTPKRAVTKRTKILAIAGVLVVVLIWAVWVSGGTGAPKVSSKLVGYTVVDQTMTTVDMQVTKGPDQTARCAVEAMNSDYAVVGWNVITIGPNATNVGTNKGTTTSMRANVRTDSLAVTGVIDSCWIVTDK